MTVYAIIPARLESKRLPGKVLREVGGKPLIRHVFERVRRAGSIDRVLIATDSDPVAQACGEFGAEVFRSQRAHPSGTDRAAEAVAGSDAEVIVNIQADEPLMDPELIDRIVRAFDDPDVQMASAARPIDGADEFLDPNAVKVVLDRHRDAIYFSRAPIPWRRDVPAQAGTPLADGHAARRHIGIYGYRRGCLDALAALPPSPLELIERLEQLRALEAGYRIRILDCDYRGVEIDTEEDLARLDRRLRS